VEGDHGVWATPPAPGAYPRAPRGKVLGPTRVPLLPHTLAQRPARASVDTRTRTTWCQMGGKWRETCPPQRPRFPPPGALPVTAPASTLRHFSNPTRLALPHHHPLGARPLRGFGVPGRTARSQNGGGGDYRPQLVGHAPHPRSQRHARVTSAASSLRSHPRTPDPSDPADSGVGGPAVGTSPLWVPNWPNYLGRETHIYGVGPLPRALVAEGLEHGALDLMRRVDLLRRHLLRPGLGTASARTLERTWVLGAR
jgi:hypothetical protein